MSRIVEFLNNLQEYGNAKVIIDEGNNKYKSYTIFIDEYGGIIANIVNYSTDKPLIIDGTINPNAKIVLSSSEDEPSESYIKTVLAKVISSTYQSAPSIIKGDNLKFDYSDFDFGYFLTIANELLKISNHSLVCSECAGSHEYLDRYLLENLKGMQPTRVEIEEIKNRADYLDLRIAYIKDLAKLLKSERGINYLNASTRWTSLYDDHKKQEEYGLKLTSN